MWLAQPVAYVFDTDAEDVREALALLRTAGAPGDLTTDAQLAALALQHRAVVPTADIDFARFPRVRWHNPLTGAGERRARRGESATRSDPATRMTLRPSNPSNVRSPETGDVIAHS